MDLCSQQVYHHYINRSQSEGLIVMEFQHSEFNKTIIALSEMKGVFYRRVVDAVIYGGL